MVNFNFKNGNLKNFIAAGNSWCSALVKRTDGCILFCSCSAGGDTLRCLLWQSEERHHLGEPLLHPVPWRPPRQGGPSWRWDGRVRGCEGRGVAQRRLHLCEGPPPLENIGWSHLAHCLTLLLVVFLQTVQLRGAAVIKARKLSSAMSAAKAICDHMRDIWFGTKEVRGICFQLQFCASVKTVFQMICPWVQPYFYLQGEFISMGVYAAGNSYGVPEDLIYSFPVQIKVRHHHGDVCSSSWRYVHLAPAIYVMNTPLEKIEFRLFLYIISYIYWSNWL